MPLLGAVVSAAGLCVTAITHSQPARSNAAMGKAKHYVEEHYEDDDLIPDPQVWKMFGITDMTGWRWTRDPKLGFPPAIKILSRNYRSKRQLEAFKKRMMDEALKNRNRKQVEGV